MSEFQSSTTVAIMISGGAVSALLGGSLADYMVKQQKARVRECRRVLAGTSDEGKQDFESEAADVETKLDEAQADLELQITKLKRVRLNFGVTGIFLALVFSTLFYIFVPRPMFGGGMFSTTAEISMVWFSCVGCIYTVVANFDEQVSLPFTHRFKNDIFNCSNKFYSLTLTGC